MNREIAGNAILNLYCIAAKKHNLEIQFYDDKRKYGRIFNEKKELFFIGSVLGINNAVSYILGKDKHRTSSILKSQGINVPEAILIDRSSSLFSDSIKRLGKPIVAKPSKSLAGQGITLQIEDHETLEKAVNNALKYGDEVMLEQQVYGKDYRILTMRDSVIDIVERVPANVIGDGTSTISELIEKKSLQRKKDNLPKLIINDVTAQLLKNENYTMESVIEKGARCFLQKACNMSIGGETKRIDLDKISDDLKKYLVKVSQSIGLDYNGIDYIVPDIYKDFGGEGYVNEVNANMDIRVHYFADMEMDNSASEAVLCKYFDLV